MSDIILVKGNIIAKSGTHVFKDLIYPIPEQSNDDYFDIIHTNSPCFCGGMFEYQSERLSRASNIAT